MMNPLLIPEVYKKADVIEEACHQALLGYSYEIPPLPARDLAIFERCSVGIKKLGLSEPEGQAKLLHDVANIELQAMELAFRTLVEFPEAPINFKEQLVSVILDERRHLELCVDEISKLGFRWGRWPVHLQLWSSVSEQDTLLDRILIVHRYLEGSGLDASHILLTKLSGLTNLGPKKIIQTIAREEEEHVSFGSRWYKEICQLNNLDVHEDFNKRMNKIFSQIPKRSVKINIQLRKQVGFSDVELDVLQRIHDNKARI